MKNLDERDRKLREKGKAFKKEKREFEIKKCGSFWCGVLQSLIASVIITILTVVIILKTKLSSNFVEIIASKLSGK